MIKVFSLTVAFALFVTGCGRAPVLSPADQQSLAKLDWLTDFDTAKAKAQAENKMLLIDFTGSDWCAPCKMLNKEVFSRADFADYAARNLVLLEVDFPRGKAQSDDQQAANRTLAQQFGIEGLPTIVVLGPRGEMLGRLGYMRGGPGAFIAALEKLRS